MECYLREICAGSLFRANKCIIPVNVLQCGVQKHMTCACSGARTLQEAVMCVCVCPPAQKEGALAGVAAGTESGLHLCAVAKVNASPWGRGRGRGRSGGGCLNTTTTSSVSNSNSNCICRRKKCAHCGQLPGTGTNTH